MEGDIQRWILPGPPSWPHTQSSPSLPGSSLPGWDPGSWNPGPPLPPVCCVRWDKKHTLSEPQVSQLYDDGDPPAPGVPMSHLGSFRPRNRGRSSVCREPGPPPSQEACSCFLPADCLAVPRPRPCQANDCQSRVKDLPAPGTGCPGPLPSADSASETGQGTDSDRARPALTPVSSKAQRTKARCLLSLLV